MTSVIRIKDIRDKIRQLGVPTIRCNGEVIGIESAPCNLGGERYYFVCPACDRRCTKLHPKLSGGVACRRCAIGRDYLQTRNLDPSTRLRHQRAKLAERLGAVEPGSFQLPPRPAGMWKRTYDRLWAAIVQIDDQRCQLLQEEGIALGLFSASHFQAKADDISSLA